MSLSPEMEKEIKEAFHFNDSNNDGKITTTEFFQAFEHLGILFSPKEIADFKKQHDQDGKRLYDFKDYNEICIPKATEYYSEAYYLEAFRAFDPDKTGFIDVQVLKRALQTLGIKMTKDEIAELLKEGNAGEDDKFDYMEYIKKLIA